jgi:peroxiredoxin
MEGLVSDLLRRSWQAVERYLVFLLLAVSLGGNVYLMLKLQLAPRSSAPSVLVGTKLPKLAVEEVGGAKAAIDWAGDTRPTLLYVFSPACVWCKRNFENFDALTRQRQADYRIIMLSTTSDGLKEYVAEHKLAWPVYANAAKDEIANITPTTFVISPDGIVKEAWPGAYIGKMKDDIEAKLAVYLPGLIASPSFDPHAE